MNISKPSIKKLIAGLLILSASAVYFFSGSQTLFERNRLPLPFGFTYCLTQENDHPRGTIQYVSPDAIRRLLSARLRGSPLILDAWIYSPNKRSLRALLSGNGNLELVVNDAPPVPGLRALFSLRLDKGYNRITIRYQPPEDEIPRLTFSITEEVPFYRYVMPDQPLSRPLSVVLSMLDRLKLVSFVLVFIYLAFRMGFVLFPISAQPLVPEDQGLFYRLFRAFSFFLVFGPLVYYLDNALKLGAPDLLLFLGGFAGALGFFLMPLFRKVRKGQGDGRTLVVLALIVVFVLLQILFESGSFLPPPSLHSDLPNHMQMMQHYQASGTILRTGNYGIYPQGLHAFIASLAGHLHLPLRGSLIIFLVAVSILIYFVIYLLGQELFGRIHYAYFFLALSLSHFPFIYSRFFKTYQFPSMVAILFFLLSLYFILKKDLALSSISLASAVITYPYYALFFAGVILFAALEWLKEPDRTTWQKVKRALIYFSVPIFSAIIYFSIYFAYGAPQHRRGFKAWFKIDPFISMQVINALLLLAGLYILLKSGKDRRALRVVLGMVIGFLGYYVPYHFFSWGSTYYFMKNMQYVILLAIPLEVVALANIFRKLEKEGWAKYTILSGAAGIYVLRILGSIRL